MNERRDYSSGGGTGGGGIYRGGRGGRGRGGGGGGGWRVGGGGGGGGYNGNRGGRGGGNRGRNFNAFGGDGGPRRPGNRFQAESVHHNNADPKQAVLQSLLQMLTQVGALQKPSTPVTQTEEERAANNSEGGSSQRAVVIAQAKNVQMLTDVVCGSNYELFLQHSGSSVHALDRFGPMCTGLVHCASVFPLQGPVYAALTLAVHNTSVSKIAVDSRFAIRTIEYCVHTLCRDLDLLLLDSNDSSSVISFSNNGDRPRAVTRCRLTLRYLCMISALNMVQTVSDLDADAVPAAINSTALSLAGLLEAMVQAAVAQAAQNDGKTPTAVLLATLVWGTIPYLNNTATTTGGMSNEWIASHLVEPLEAVVTASYQSEFTPGIGKQSILLKEEQLEDIDNEGGDDDEEEEEAEDDDDASGQICDSLQDLLRSVKHYLQEKEAIRFTLFADAPWKELQAPSMAAAQPQEGDNAYAEPPTDTVVQYKGEPVQLAIFPTCKSLSMLLLGGQVADTNAVAVLAKDVLQGTVFGRLPLFGPPPNLDDEGDGDDMDDTPVITNERLKAYQNNFGVTDRYFVGEAVRDILLSHESSVSDSGVERGNAKNTAEQVWSLSLMMNAIPNGDASSCRISEDDPAKGIEYSVLETMLSLITQCSHSSAFSLMYLSRVVLELTRLEPAILSPAIAVAVSNLFSDYMPALVPSARYNLSRWFAFHLIHTEYQWPAAYWKHWGPFVLHGWSNSRGSFVKAVLEHMVENLSNPELLVTECLPKESILIDHLLSVPPNSSPFSESTLQPFESSIKQRLAINEDPESILSYLLGEELTESVAAVLDTAEAGAPYSWWRTGLVVRALLSPAVADYERCKLSVEQARSANEGDMDDDNGGTRDDVLLMLLDAIVQCKPVLLGAFAKDAEYQGKGELARGEVFLLEQLYGVVFYSRTLFHGCIQEFFSIKLLKVENIFKWLLGDFGDEGNARVVLRWWELATFSIHLGMVDAMSTNADNEMSNEDDAETSSGLRKVKAVVQFLDPLLSYAVRQVGTLLGASGDQGKGNKLAPEQVDLVEGFKVVVTETEGMYLSMLRKESGLSVVDLQDVWNESAVAGPRLASLVDIGGIPAVEMLRRSLERM